MIPALVHRLTGGAGQADQPADLRRMAEALHGHVPGIAVEAYFAGREPDGRVGFVRVT